MARRLSNKAKLKSLLRVTSLGTTMFAGICLYQGNEKFYNEIAMPLVRLLDPETAHNVAIKALKWGFIPKNGFIDPPSLQTNVFGLQLQNPVGLAAGFDKQGEALKGLFDSGFSFVEIGSVTPKAQSGNPKPRVFRLLADNAVINRYGFNSDGHEEVHERLTELRKDKSFSGIVGVNLGKNKTSEDAAQDYIDGLVKFADVADYFVINISSPNTPGLRNLQNKKELEDLLKKVNAKRFAMNIKQPLLLKLAPDLSESERQDIANTIRKKETKVDGLVLCNTTVSRDNLVDPNKKEIGGLSGAPLTDVSTAMIADMYKRTKGEIPIIGVGGVFNGEDAYAKIKAGASLIQIYTSYIYHGPPIVNKIKKELNDILHKNGYNSITEAVGKNM